MKNIGRNYYDGTGLCPACGAVAVRRQGYRTEVCGLGAGGGCAACGENLSMVTGAASV